MNSVVSLLCRAACAAALTFLVSTTDATAQSTLVSAGSNWHYHKGTNAPQTNWKTIADASLNAGGPHVRAELVTTMVTTPRS
ncbi:MAG: hypothetical protein IPK15_13795 [Verrucomicrobia bacterium]|nr:hypothetical protein [Verrucomicrobiota bacterium]